VLIPCSFANNKYDALTDVRLIMLFHILASASHQYAGRCVVRRAAHVGVRPACPNARNTITHIVVLQLLRTISLELTMT
jgi:hypothetical protein